MEFIAGVVFKVLYCALGAYLIAEALDRYEKKHYYLVGINIMLAIWMIGQMLKF